MSKKKNKKDYERRARNHFILFYPDNEAHINAISYIAEKQWFYEAIMHDKDYNKEGELKKEHYHYIVHSDEARTRSAIAKELGIETNLIEPIDDIKAAFRYLLHLDNDDKTKYDISELFGNMGDKASKFCKEKLDLNDFTNNLLDWLENKDCYVSYKQVLRYASNQNSVGLLRNISFWNLVLEEHNEKYK